MPWIFVENLYSTLQGNKFVATSFQSRYLVVILVNTIHGGGFPHSYAENENRDNDSLNDIEIQRDYIQVRSYNRIG